jgi:cellulose synthase/poly-beta-1,6-N-acetylglucosamine synthase-like glycosyltransferase
MFFFFVVCCAALSLYGGGLAYVCIMLLMPDKQSRVTRNDISPGISIIIPFKNEVHNLAPLLLSLQAQTYTGSWEIILVNDASSDAFKTILAPFIANASPPVRLVDSHFDSAIRLTSKQQALELGVQTAHYGWLIFTDADMFFDPGWLQSFADAIPDGHDLIFGHTVITSPSRSLLNRLQAYQLAFLFAAAYAFHRAHLPASCMGNNILVRKDAYSAVGGQPGLGYTITEDFKLLEAFRHSHYSIGTPRNFLPLAYTHPCPSLATYYHQMLRWARGGFSRTSLLLPAGFLFTVQNIMLIGALLGFAPHYCAVFSVVNFMLTILFLGIVFKKTEAKENALYFPAYYIVVILETIIFAFSFIITPGIRWKNRKL